MKKEVLILTSENPERPGGVEHLVRELARGLEARDYEVAVLHRANSLPPRLRTSANWLSRQLSSLLLGFYVGREVRRRLHQGVAALISNGPVGWLPIGLPNGSSCRQIHFYHGTYRGQADAIRPLISRPGYLKLKWWEAMLFENCSGRRKLCLSNSDQTRDEVLRFFGHSARTVWLPLDTAHFRPLQRSACRREFRLQENAPVGLFVGSTHPQKGFPVVRSLTESLPHVSWLLAMRGDVPQELSAKHNVRVLPDAPYALLPRLYSAADFSVCPSRYESFGYAVAESLACGTPVIASPGGASRLFLQRPPLDRLLIPDANDVSAFRAAVIDLLHDPTSYRSAIQSEVRPLLQDLLAPENWWPRFLAVTGL
ncbi:MAG: glycosyltransferase family 4 protein [Thermoanaerobaculia bacterium]